MAMVLDRLFLWIFTIAVIGKFSFPFNVTCILVSSRQAKDKDS